MHVKQEHKNTHKAVCFCEKKLYFCTNVQTTLTWSRSNARSLNSDLYSSQRSETQQLQGSPKAAMR